MSLCNKIRVRLPYEGRVCFTGREPANGQVGNHANSADIYWSHYLLGLEALFLHYPPTACYKAVAKNFCLAWIDNDLTLRLYSLCRSVICGVWGLCGQTLECWSIGALHSAFCDCTIWNVCILLYCCNGNVPLYRGYHSFANIILLILQDFLLSMVPTLIMWKVQMERQQKIAVILAMSTGCLWVFPGFHYCGHHSPMCL